MALSAAAAAAADSVEIPFFAVTLSKALICSFLCCVVVPCSHSSGLINKVLPYSKLFLLLFVEARH